MSSTASRTGEACVAPSALVMGSSPIMMCVAIRLATAGWRVEVHDERGRPGGAWSTIEAFGHGNIEPAVHLLENRPAVYRHLVESLHVDLEPEFRPQGRMGRSRLGFHATRASMFGLVGLKAFSRGDFNRASIAARSFGRSLRYLRTGFAYPSGGSGRLTATLATRLGQLGVGVHLDSRIDTCTVRSGMYGVECRTPEGVRRFDRLVLSSRSHPRVRIDDEILDFKATPTDVRTVLLHVATSDPIGFGYIELMGDPDLARVRNVGRFADPELPPNRAILALQVRNSSRRLNADTQDLGQECSRLLRARRLLGSSAEALDHLDLRYRHHTIPAPELRRLARRSGDRVLGITTTDFAEDLVGILDRPASSWMARTSG